MECMIEETGLDDVAAILKIPINKLREKNNNPKLFTLHELATLIEKKVITDKMVLLMLDKLKREA